MDRIEAEANKGMKQELGEKWDEKTYEDIRKNPIHCGFSSKYLYLSADYKEFTTSVEISTLLKLAKLDLEKGTTIPELVFSCCKWFPKKEAIKRLIQLRKENETEQEVVKSVLEFQNHQGYNCLIESFQMASWYRNKTDKYPSGPMLRDIEESCIFLIQKAKDLKLDLDKILNHTAKDGLTLFSEEIGRAHV